MVICLEQGADLHMAQWMPLPLTVSCFSKIQINFTFLVPAHLGSPGKGPLNGCVCLCVRAMVMTYRQRLVGSKVEWKQTDTTSCITAAAASNYLYQ